MVIIAHSAVQSGSRVNKRFMEELIKNDHILVHDLYGAYPQGDINVQQEQLLLSEYDRIIFQFPFWWYSSPALLKQWFDQVLTFGWAFGPGGDKLHGKEWGFAITAGSPPESYGREGYNRYTIEELTRPFEATANLVGAVCLPVFAITGALNLTDDELEQAAEQYLDYVTRSGSYAAV